VIWREEAAMEADYNKASPYAFTESNNEHVHGSHKSSVDPVIGAKKTDKEN
jgi:hypothetical protein